MGNDRARDWLCRVEEIEDPGSRGFAAGIAGRLVDLLVVRRGNNVYAYANHCPHTGSPLDWMPDEFLSIDKKHIQCATHDALFRIDDGRCVSGPCHGDSLEAILVEIRFGRIYLHTNSGKP